MISIIVPAYKVELFLEQCIESILAQTCQDIEVLLVDDGSPDQCGVICDSWATRDQRIRVIHQDNAGVAAARNAALNLAKGEYVGFVDPDDWIAPGMYGKMLECIEKYNADIVVCGYTYCSEAGETDEMRPYVRRPEECIDRKEAVRRMADIPPTLRHVVWNKLFRRSLVGDIRFPEDFRSSEDVFFLTDCLLKAGTVVCIHEPLYYNRVRGGSATHGGLSIHELAHSFKAHEYMYRRIIETYPDLKAVSQAFYLDVMELKYNEACRRQPAERSTEENRDLQRMKKMIRSEAVKALLNGKIYWKTRISYLMSLNGWK